jgi:ribosomal protein S18 acetylase RimI-like enzyme
MNEMSIKLIAVTEEWYDFVRICRTAPENQSGFIEQKPITVAMQHAYMSKYKDCYRIAVNQNTEGIGYIGDVDNDIRIAVHPNYKGKGMGKIMLSLFMESRREGVAKVLKNNQASLRLFTKCNFKIEREDETFYFLKYSNPLYS